MPIYEYRCEECGHELEKLQRMSDDPLRDCPACGAAQLKRLVSAAGFRLKGSGWYETDFKQDGRRNLADSGDGSGKDGEGKGKQADSKSKDTAKESAPAAKQEPAAEKAKSGTEQKTA